MLRKFNPAPALQAASLVDRLSQKHYRSVSASILRAAGIRVNGLPLWISPRVYWDFSERNMITIEDRSVISHYVKLLTHDYSMDRVAESINGLSDLEYWRRAPIVVGAGSFIGMGSMILPGVKIGAHSIVGASSVVVRDVSPGTIVAGNPARELTTIEDFWAKKGSTFSVSPRRR